MISGLKSRRRMNVRRHARLIAAVLFAALVGCHQREQPKGPTPGTTTSQATQPPPPPATEPATQPSSQPATQPATEAGAQRRFRITSPGVKPDQPISILSKLESSRPARVSASLQSDHFLVLETANVGFLRIDLLNLPRSEGGRLVVHIDGQGLEITGRGSKIVYLQRTSVGSWTFTKAPAGL